MALKEFSFSTPIRAGLFVGAGGFEDRSLGFPASAAEAGFGFERALLVSYGSQLARDDDNFVGVQRSISQISQDVPAVVFGDAERPVAVFAELLRRVRELADGCANRQAIVDISGLTRMWALAAVHACQQAGLSVSVIYTEAKVYFPLKSEWKPLVAAWRDQRYEEASTYLQTSAFRGVHIVPEFGGSFRTGTPTCLQVFLGYEPNRVEGLVDAYAPGALVVYFGRSPHEDLRWRTQLSRELHEDLFTHWWVHKEETSTLDVDEVVTSLEVTYETLHEKYDLALAPACSKLQTLASYLFWRRHPEVQIVFTSPVSFNQDRAPTGCRRTFVYSLD